MKVSRNKLERKGVKMDIFNNIEKSNDFDIDELKVKFERGYTIQIWEDYDAGEDSYEDTHTGHWEDCENPTWETDRKYRVKPDEEGYLSPKEREMYKNDISKLYKKTGSSLYDGTDFNTDFENWWKKAITTYTMPPNVNKHWCKMAYMAALGIE